MKQIRGLLIAVVALAVLAGLVYWSNKHKADEAAKPAADAPPKILTLDSKKIDEVQVKKTGSDPIVLTKLADKWEITKPEPMPADQDTVNTLISSASDLTSERLIDDHPGNLAPFGLTPPVTQVTMNLKGGKPVTLLFGKDTPAGGSTYVKVSTDPRVFTVPSTTKSNIDKPLNDLRDKRLLTFNQEKLSRVELTAKNATVEFGKNGQNEWQILKPAPYRADALPVDELVRKLQEAKVQLDAGKVAPSTFQAAPKISTVAFTDNSGTQTVEIRQDKDKNTYAKSSATDGIYKIGADVVDATNKTLTDFRSKKLFDFGFTELASVTAQGTTYTHNKDKWFANGKEMDGPSIQTLIDKLRDLTATGFATKSAGTQVFTASIASQDKKRIETINILNDNGNYLGIRDGEPAIYTLDAAVVGDLLKAAADVKPVAPAKPVNTPPAKK
jgi:hypothetical protein